MPILRRWGNRHSAGASTARLWQWSGRATPCPALPRFCRLAVGGRHGCPVGARTRLGPAGEARLGGAADRHHGGSGVSAHLGGPHLGAAADSGEGGRGASPAAVAVGGGRGQAPVAPCDREEGRREEPHGSEDPLEGGGSPRRRRPLGPGRPQRHRWLASLGHRRAGTHACWLAARGGRERIDRDGQRWRGTEHLTALVVADTTAPPPRPASPALRRRRLTTQQAPSSATRTAVLPSSSPLSLSPWRVSTPALVSSSTVFERAVASAPDASAGRLPPYGTVPTPPARTPPAPVRCDAAANTPSPAPIVPRPRGHAHRGRRPAAGGGAVDGQGRLKCDLLTMWRRDATRPRGLGFNIGATPHPTAPICLWPLAAEPAQNAVPADADCGVASSTSSSLTRR